jgi:hypothetical protein
MRMTSSPRAPAPLASPSPARLWTLGAKLSPARAPSSGDPDWQQADPTWIKRSLRRALALPSGHWYAVDASRAIGDRPRRYRVCGRELVAWRDGKELRFGPDACPHMGASLAEGRVRDGCVVCPWHGLALGRDGHGGWRPLPGHDDGVLAWVRLPGGDEPPTPAPILAERPTGFIDGVIRMEARCDPEDVIANRLDPWHGVHFHPHSFGRLSVIDQQDDAITVRVVYRIAGRVGIEVDARFHCPDPRTIAMTIVDGEGAGSVVETHATPIEPGRSVILEATLAASSRRGFAIARRTSRFIRPMIERAARRLWVEDAAYAERRYALRRGELR